MRLLCGLWLWLSLLKVLQAQTPTPLPLPPPMQSFQGNQFQGEWFVLGLAGNSFRPEHRALLNAFTATFELSDDGRFEVWNAMTRGQHCDTWSYVLIPAAQPGQFTVDHGVDTRAGWPSSGSACWVSLPPRPGPVCGPGGTSFQALGQTLPPHPAWSDLGVQIVQSPTYPAPNPLPSAQTHAGLPGLQAGAGCCLPGRWTSSSAWAELRASRMTTLSSQM
ncbi:epididymal-specific lipocalin-12 isoform X3 [Homo sapiens]|uniref:epididymal-specific lipocalin-12 isoform X3 n=1 Tax=Homo sapiens TaxID=9606 RepID=UPI0023DFBDE5|nr:epididymal-specific lipocalin-12 isoform X3 [Homo sapiens]